MTLSFAMQFAAASVFVLSSASAAQAYGRLPDTPTMNLPTPLKTEGNLPQTALDFACANPGRMADDGTTIYIKVDHTSQVVAIPVAFAEENWDAEKRQFPLPENLERVLCPI